MKFFFAIMIVLGVVGSAAAQVQPEATSPGKLGVSGTLTYSAQYSQLFESYSGTNGQMANVSGTFGYLSTSERHPATINLSAGDSWGISGISFSSGPYETGGVSQAFDGQHLSLQLSDHVSYQTGVPLGMSNPNSPNSTAEPILTLNETMFDNDSNANLSYKFSGSSQMSAGVTYNLLDFPNGNALNTDSFMANAGFNHRLEARNSLFVQYAFSRYSFSGENAATGANTAPGSINVVTNTPIAGWVHVWNRRISSTVSAGPQWISFQVGAAAPPTTGYSVNASVVDKLKAGSASMNYSHGVNAGGGFLYGAEVDEVNASFTREFGQNARHQLSISLAMGYLRTNALSSLSSMSLANVLGLQENYDSTYGSAQVSKKLGRLFSVSAQYTGSNQTSSSPAYSGLLNGLWQTAYVGLGFTPPQIHLRH